MKRFVLALLGLLVFALEPAHAERWLRAVPNEKPTSRGAYSWFDVDTVAIDKKSNLLLARAAVLTVKAVRAGGVNAWTLWGFDCKGRKAYAIGSFADGKFTQTTNWKTDPKAAVALGAAKPDAVADALATRICPWRDIWPAGALP